VGRLRYKGGFLTPLQEIDPEFDLLPEFLRCEDSGYRNAEKEWRATGGSALMIYSPHSHVQLFCYWMDLYEKAGLKPLETWDDVLAACGQIQDGIEVCPDSHRQRWPRRHRPAGGFCPPWCYWGRRAEWSSRRRRCAPRERRLSRVIPRRRAPPVRSAVRREAEKASAP
jgi:hypothetical protein